MNVTKPPLSNYLPLSNCRMPKIIIFQTSFGFNASVNCGSLWWNATSINVLYNLAHETLISAIGVPLWCLDVACKIFGISLKFLLYLEIHIKYDNTYKYSNTTILRRPKYTCKHFDILIYVEHKIATVSIWKNPKQYPCKNMKKANMSEKEWSSYSLSDTKPSSSS